VKVRRNSLCKLEKLRRAKHVLQLRLANENNLQELLLIGIYVRQHSKLFKRLHTQVLRLVDNIQRVAAPILICRRGAKLGYGVS